MAFNPFKKLSETAKKAQDEIAKKAQDEIEEKVTAKLDEEIVNPTLREHHGEPIKNPKDK